MKINKSTFVIKERSLPPIVYRRIFKSLCRYISSTYIKRLLCRYISSTYIKRLSPYTLQTMPPKHIPPAQPWGKFKHIKTKRAAIGLSLFVLVGASPAILLYLKRKELEYNQQLNIPASK